MSSDTFLIGRLTAIETAIVSCEDGLATLSTGTLSVSVNTGQGSHAFTRQQISSLEQVITSLYQRRDAMRSRLGLDCGGFVVSMAE